jgi:hypothetical protein
MPRPPSGLIPVGYRDMPEQLAQIDRVAEQIAPEGKEPNRSDATRLLIGEALAVRDLAAAAAPFLPDDGVARGAVEVVRFLVLEAVDARSKTRAKLPAGKRPRTRPARKAPAKAGQP